MLAINAIVELHIVYSTQTKGFGKVELWILLPLQRKVLQNTKTCTF